MRGLSIDPRMQRLGFDLRGIPGLEAAWLSRFPSGLGTMALPADGTAMGTWTDLSGKGRDLTQATGANRPLWRKAGVNLLTEVVGKTSSLTGAFAPWQCTTSVDTTEGAYKMSMYSTQGTIYFPDVPFSGRDGKTISFQSSIKLGDATSGKGSCIIQFLNQSKGIVGASVQASTVTVGTGYSITSKTGIVVPSGTAYVRMSIYLSVAESGKTYFVKYPQLELGPTATPWLPPGNSQGMQFDGVNDSLQTVPLAGWPETTVYAVATPVGSFTSAQRVMSWNGGGNTGFDIYLNGQGDQKYRSVSRNAAGSSWVIRNGPVISDVAVMTTELGNENMSWLNGAPVGVVDVTNGFTPPTTASLSVGQSTAGSNPLDGLLHDLIVCSQAHDDTTRQRVEAALARANGVTLVA